MRVPRLELRRAPLLAAVCWFALGELMARNWQPPLVLLVGVVLLFLLSLVALRRSLRLAIVPLAALWMAIGFWSAETQPAPSTQHALLTYADGLSRQIRGRVVRVRQLPPESVGSDRDKEAGWWPRKGGERGGSGRRCALGGSPG
jgi:competence protein ComEC